MLKIISSSYSELCSIKRERDFLKLPEINLGIEPFHEREIFRELLCRANSMTFAVSSAAFAFCGFYEVSDFNFHSAMSMFYPIVYTQQLAIRCQFVSV